MLNVPPVSQLTTVTDEKGEISDNAQMDCVAASVDMLCRYVLGTPENSIFNPDSFKDKAYWDAYVGGTAAIEYVTYCKSLGVRLYSMDASDYAHLVTLARSFIKDHKQPCLFTRDDPYVDQRVHPDWSHVCVFKGEDDAGLTAHDPYIDRAVYKTDGGWASVLRSAQLWIAERIDETVKIDITTPGVAPYFEEVDTHHWKCKQTGHVLAFAILDTYKGYGNSLSCGLSHLGLPLSDEIAIAPGGIVKQHFERGVLAYDPVPRHIDNPPGWGAVYPMHLYSGPGQDPGIPKLEAVVTDLQAANNMQAQKIVDLQKVAPSQNPLATQALADMHQVKAIADKY